MALQRDRRTGQTDVWKFKRKNKQTKDRQTVGQTEKGQSERSTGKLKDRQIERHKHRKK